MLQVAGHGIQQQHFGECRIEDGAKATRGGSREGGKLDGVVVRHQLLHQRQGNQNARGVWVVTEKRHQRKCLGNARRGKQREVERVDQERENRENSVIHALADL